MFLCIRGGSSKTPQTTNNIFLQKAKSPWRKNFPEKSKMFSMSSFSSTFFCFIAFSDVSQRWEFKNTTNYKKIMSKSFYKKIDKKPIVDFVYHVFGRFSVRGVKKNLVLFWPLTHPPTTGGHRLFLAAPWPETPAGCAAHEGVVKAGRGRGSAQPGFHQSTTCAVYARDCSLSLRLFFVQVYPAKKNRPRAHALAGLWCGFRVIFRTSQQ
jgi:hypothetical protein